MKIIFNEYEWGVEFNLEPESVEDVAKLARFAKNAKAEKPSVYLSVSGIPYMSVFLKKVSVKSQSNIIKP